MSTSRRKAVFAFVAMSCSAGLAFVGVPDTRIADTWQTDLEEMFPAQFGDWTVDKSIPVILPAPDVQAKLDKIYNQVLARTYVNTTTGERVMLSVAYGGDQSDGMQAHLPEVCYPAQGFELKQTRSVVLDVAGRRVPARQITTRLGSRVEPVTYWLTLGESVAATRTERKIRQMEYGLRGIVPDGMLVRVSSIGPNTVKGFEVQQRFIADMVGAVPPQHINRVVGASG